MTYSKHRRAEPQHSPTAHSGGHKLPGPEKKVDGAGAGEHTSKLWKAEACRLGFQELEEMVLEASVLGPLHLNPGRARRVGRR